MPAIFGSCLCGAVRWKVPYAPQWLVSCNCSACRRYGALWAHYRVDEVVLEGETRGYMRGDRSLAFCACPICGSVTHYRSVPGTDPSERLSVNMRMAPPEVWRDIRIRHFDGADSWEFLD